MAEQDFRDRLRVAGEAASDAACWARNTSDTVNLAAWGENNTESGPAWVSFHARTVDQLCEHIDNLVAIITRGTP